MLSTKLINDSLESSEEVSKQSTSFEEVSFQNAVYYLQHKTKIEYLPAIIKSGFLIPRSQQKNPNNYMGGLGEVTYLKPYVYDPGEDTIEILSGSYCNLTSIGGKKSGDLSNALLLFDVKLLSDRNDYYGNTNWLNYGKKVDASFLPEQIKDPKKTPIKKLKEICFSNPIDLSKYLTQIWIHPTKRDEVIQSLRNENIEEAWINMISAYEFHPQITYTVTLSKDYILQTIPYKSDQPDQNNCSLVSVAPNSIIFSPPKKHDDPLTRQLDLNTKSTPQYQN